MCVCVCVSCGVYVGVVIVVIVIAFVAAAPQWSLLLYCCRCYVVNINSIECFAAVDILFQDSFHCCSSYTYVGVVIVVLNHFF